MSSASFSGAAAPFDVVEDEAELELEELLLDAVELELELELVLELVLELDCVLSADAVALVAWLLADAWSCDGAGALHRTILTTRIINSTATAAAAISTTGETGNPKGAPAGVFEAAPRRGASTCERVACLRSLDPRPELERPPPCPEALLRLAEPWRLREFWGCEEREEPEEREDREDRADASLRARRVDSLRWPCLRASRSRAACRASSSV